AIPAYPKAATANRQPQAPAAPARSAGCSDQTSSAPASSPASRTARRPRARTGFAVHPTSGQIENWELPALYRLVVLRFSVLRFSVLSVAVGPPVPPADRSTSPASCGT